MTSEPETPAGGPDVEPETALPGLDFSGLAEIISPGAAAQSERVRSLQTEVASLRERLTHLENVFMSASDAIVDRINNIEVHGGHTGLPPLMVPGIVSDADVAQGVAVARAIRNRITCSLKKDEPHA